jgi:hypothetical protein
MVPVVENAQSIFGEELEANAASLPASLKSADHKSSHGEAQKLGRRI